ncbi:MAG: hypothetical protein NZM28_09705 [Fimbriimonadales bacterium]|nr:hypothetical protein [Fimbriimonadales bacterium]
MTPPKAILEKAAQFGMGLVSFCMPVPPPAERELQSGVQVALSESLARIDEAGRRFAQRLQQAHGVFRPMHPPK